MLLRVMGVERKKGDFTDRQTKEKIEYDNVILHCMNVDTSPFNRLGMVCGNRVAEIKLKNDFDSLVYVGEFGVVHSFADLNGCDIDLGMDAEGKILGIAVVSADEKE